MGGLEEGRRQTDGPTVAVDRAGGRGCRSAAGAGRVENDEQGGDDGMAGKWEAAAAAGSRRGGGHDRQEVTPCA